MVFLSNLFSNVVQCFNAMLSENGLFTSADMPLNNELMNKHEVAHRSEV